MQHTLHRDISGGFKAQLREIGFLLLKADRGPIPEP